MARRENPETKEESRHHSIRHWNPYQFYHGHLFQSGLSQQSIDLNAPYYW